LKNEFAGEPAWRRALENSIGLVASCGLVGFVGIDNRWNEATQ
jgi:hypothetical protein